MIRSDTSWPNTKLPMRSKSQGEIRQEAAKCEDILVFSQHNSVQGGIHIEIYIYIYRNRPGSRFL